MQANAHRLNFLSIQEGAVVGCPEGDLVLAGDRFCALGVSSSDRGYTHIRQGQILLQMPLTDLPDANYSYGERFVFDRSLFSSVCWLNLPRWMRLRN
jgi:hypothetical protein